VKGFLLGGAVFGLAFIAMQYWVGLTQVQAIACGIIMIVACAIDNAIDP
jgi:hypothetical protein